MVAGNDLGADLAVTKALRIFGEPGQMEAHVVAVEIDMPVQQPAGGSDRSFRADRMVGHLQSELPRNDSREKIGGRHQLKRDRLPA